MERRACPGHEEKGEAGGWIEDSSGRHCLFPVGAPVEGATLTLLHFVLLYFLVAVPLGIIVGNVLKANAHPHREGGLSPLSPPSLPHYTITRGETDFSR
jgi:hypothetical protein